MSDDAELLSRYAEQQSEVAFAELTGRYVDLVYSAALRLVGGVVPSAQDVTQQVFTEVARQSRQLARHPAFVGWLYTTTRHLALRVNRTEQRRKVREQEAHTMNELLHDDAPASDWAQLRTVIEDAMHELGEQDRHAVLLRFFQNKSLNDVGAALNLTENAARMRVERALDKLRGKLARRGITTTTAALAAVVSANAIQAAPPGLALTISAAAITGSAIPTATLIAATKALAMTTLQKTIVTVALTAAVGTGIYAVHSRSQQRGEILTLQQQQAPLTAQLQELEQQRTRLSNQVAALSEENAQLKSGRTATELLKLRGEVGTLRQRAASSEAKASQPAAGLDKLMSDPAMKEYIHKAQMEKIKSMFGDLIKELKLNPAQTDQFLDIMSGAATKSLAQIASQGPPDQAAIDAAQERTRQLVALLGNTGCARLEEYGAEIPGRTTVTLLNSELGDTPLSNEQKARLIQVVKSEPNNLTQGITGAPDKVFLGSQSEIDDFLGQVAQSNQRILQQSASFLSADQSAALEAILTKAIEGRKLQAAALIQKH